MQSDVMLKDSFGYAKGALVGKWVRWITFIILILPLALVNFVFDPHTLFNQRSGAVSWELVPWDQVAVLVIIGILLQLFFAGYKVRIYRGINPAPELDNWAGLFIDGLKLTIVWLLWFLPILVALASATGLIVLSFASGVIPQVSFDIAFMIMLLLGLLACIATIITFLYAYLGTVHFARTGSIREGIRFSKVTEMIRTLGWLSYLTALLVLFVIMCMFSIIALLLHGIPFIGWVLVMMISPFVTILYARYITLVYEEGEIPEAAIITE
jgi:hypothetical protein